MARILYGARGAMWQAPDWVARNVFGEVVAVLRGMSEGGIVTQRLAERLGADCAVVDLTGLLADPLVRGAWLHALDIAVLRLGAERSEDWNEPYAFSGFMGSIRRLIEAEHAHPATAGSSYLPEPADVVIAALPWVLDDGLDR